MGESLVGLRGLIFSVEMIKGRHFPHLFDPKIDSTLDMQLHRHGYSIRYFKQDGNTAAKVLALRIYGHQKFHRKVRKELSQYLQCQHEFWGKLRQDENYLEHISRFSFSGEVFTPTELLAAAKFYNTPIVCPSIKSDRYLIVLNAYTLEGNKRDPIYLHRKGMLVHKTQTELLLQYEKSLKPFIVRMVRIM